MDGGIILTSPRIVPVFFANDDAHLEDQLTTFEKAIGQSSYWTATTSEYGVGSATATDRVVMTENAPDAITDNDIAAWLRTKLDGSDTQLPAPDDNTLYVLHYPATTTISASGGTYCTGFIAYHSAVRPTTPGQRWVPFAVIPRCHSNSDLDHLTNPLTHELVEAATDPVPGDGYSDADADHQFWTTAFDGTEVGDMCEHNLFTSFTFPDFPYAVQRTWSNAAAAAGHDPCVPHLPGHVYFNAAPEMAHDMSFVDEYGDTLTGKGVLVPVGCSVTIPIDLFSEADTGGPWYVHVNEATAAGNLQLTLDSTQGQNGDKLHLTITTLAANPSNAESFMVVSAQGLELHSWVGLVDETPGPCP